MVLSINIKAGNYSGVTMPGISPIKKTTFSLLAVPVAMSLMVCIGFNSPEQQAQAMVGSLDSPMDLRLAAMESVLKGDTERALSVYSTAIEAATRQYGANSMFLADLYYEAGNLASKQDLFDKAENYLSQAVKINPRMSMARMELAELQKRRQKPMEALEQIQSDLAAHPESLVARQQFVRWLASNGGSAQDGAIAHQESLRVLAMSTTSRSVKPGAEMLKAFQRPTGKPSAVAPAKTTVPEPVSTNESEPKDEPSETSKIQPMMSLPTRPNIKKSDDLKAEKAKEEAHKKENEQRLKEEKEREQRKRGERAREERERDARERENRNKEAARLAAAKAKSNKTKAVATETTKPAATPPAEKPKPVKEVTAAAPTVDSATSESDAKAEARSKKTATKAKPAQEVLPQVVPTLQPLPQAYYPPVPVFNPPNRGKPKPGFVPPPPPTAFPNVYGGGMIPGPPMVIQTPQPVAKPKPKPKPAVVKKVEEAPKEPVEDKPPPMNAAPQEGDPDFLLDWADLKEKKKKRTR
jgi:tetratricopeptide (TPR) repeat protein